MAPDRGKAGRLVALAFQRGWLAAEAIERARTLVAAGGEPLAEIEREGLLSPGQIGELLERDVRGTDTARLESYGAPEDPAGPSPERLGRYRILRVLGRGGMGIVYEARDEALGRPVALKLLRPDLTADPRAAERFEREIRIAAGLVHENVVRVHDVGREGGALFYAMELLAGHSLERYVAESRMHPEQAARLALGICRGLAYAHSRGVVHRDVKPSNAIVVPGEDRERPVLVDFGLARQADLATMTATREILGTPAYMSPEQASGEALAVGPLSDVYSAGATLYALLAGRPVHDVSELPALLARIQSEDPTPLRKVCREIPIDLERVVQTAMEKEPARRYPSMAAMAADLEAFLEGRPIRARPAGPLGRLARRARRHPRVAAVLGTSAAVALAAMGFAGLQKVRDLARIREERDRALLAERSLARRSRAQDLVLEAVRLADSGASRERVLATFDRAALEDPDYHGTYQQRGRYRLELGEIAEAKADLERALERQPVDSVALFYLFLALERQRAEPTETEAVLARLRETAGGGELRLWAEGRARIELALADPGAQARRAGLLEAVGLLDEALACFPRFARAFVDRARALSALGQFDRALEDAARASEIDPEYAGPHRVRGWTLERMVRLEEAIDAFDRALYLDPSDSELFADRASAELAAGRLREAEADVLRVLAAERPPARAFALAIWTLGERRGPDAAARLAAKALAIHPDEPEILDAAAHAIGWEGGLDQAEALAERWTLLAPNDPRAWLRRGVLEIARGDLDRAEDHLDRALPLSEPWSSLGETIFEARSRILFALAHVARGRGGLQEALALCEGARQPRFPWAKPHLLEATIHSEAGREAEARAALDEAAKIPRERIDTVLARSAFLERLGSRAEAVAALREGLAAHPGSFRLASALRELDPGAPQDSDRAGEELRESGVAALDAGRFEDAARLLGSAAAAGPEDAQNHLALAELAIRGPLGKETALGPLARAIARDPGNASLLARRGEILRDLDRFEDSLADLDRAVRLDPTPKNLRLRALTYDRMGRRSEALADLDRVLEIDPAWAAAAYLRARLRYSGGEYERALADAERALEIDPSLAVARLVKGYSCQALGRHREAIGELSLFLEALPASSEAAQARQVIQECRAALAREERGG